jgi:exonuclease SbcC
LRPLSLIMQAFGPYAQREEIDFRRLGERSLFLIHGPTGSGKTTILDAMCFALYGDTSGNIRRGRDMRSQHADGETLTEITFDFSLGGRCYRVHRVPEQQRPMKRGDGMTIQKSSATLWRLHDAGGPGSDEKDVVETQWSRVTESIEAILGFRSDQFRQVIMLPQGQFHDLLTESSKQREAILEILFRTEIYRRIEEGLKAAAKELTDRLDEINKHRTFILGRAQAADAPELGRHLQNLESTLAETRKHLERLRARESKTRAHLQAARDLDALFGERKQAEEDLARFLDAEHAMAENTRRLKLARKAAGLAAVEETMLERQAEGEEAVKMLEAARRTLAAAEERKSDAAKALTREKRRATNRTAAGRKVMHLESLAGQIGGLESARTGMEALGKDMQSLSRVARERRKAIKDLGLHTGSLEKAVSDARESAARAPALVLHLERSRINLERRQGLDDVGTRLKAGRKTLRSAEKEAKRVQAQFDEARRLLARMEQEWRSGQAGVLAGTLRPGEACPVCGSTEHPRPAVLPPDVPDQTGLRSQREEVESLEQQRDRARETLAAEQREISRLEAEALSLKKNLGDAADLSLRSVKSEVKRLQGDLAGARAAEQALKQGKTDLEKSKAYEADLRKLLEAGEAALKKAESAFESARAVVAERERKLPKALRTSGRLEEALRQARDDQERLLGAFEKARELETDTRQRYAEAKVTADGAGKTLTAATRRLRTARGRFAKRLRAAGFSGPEAYEDARLDESEIDALAHMIDEHAAGTKAARLRLTRARQATRGKKRLDVAALEGEAEDAKARCEEKIAEAAEIKKEHGRIAGLGEELASAEREIKTLEKHYYVTGRIAEVANGRNDQGITFQRFVLAALLDEVLRAANERLRLMSRGRYDLHRAGERADRRLAGGLDLEVFDAFTGEARPVSTLSGGETFLAALSLALGLADVVQAHAGGIHLETIFIDEGFGSLDPEALDLALRALTDLQKGNRLVGIISHVPELKERIDVRLEVTGTGLRGGSKLRFAGI